MACFVCPSGVRTAAQQRLKQALCRPQDLVRVKLLDWDLFAPIGRGFATVNPAAPAISNIKLCPRGRGSVGLGERTKSMRSSHLDAAYAKKKILLENQVCAQLRRFDEVTQAPERHGFFWRQKASCTTLSWARTCLAAVQSSRSTSTKKSWLCMSTSCR